MGFIFSGTACMLMTIEGLVTIKNDLKFHVKNIQLCQSRTP